MPKRRLIDIIDSVEKRHLKQLSNIPFPNFGGLNLTSLMDGGVLHIGLFENHIDHKPDIEASYEGYARVPVDRTFEEWNIEENKVENKHTITFPESTGGNSTVRSFKVFIDDIPVIENNLTSALTIIQGVRAEFAIGDLSIDFE